MLPVAAAALLSVAAGPGLEPGPLPIVVPAGAGPEPGQPHGAQPIVVPADTAAPGASGAPVEPRAQVALGDDYFQGRGVKQDYRIARSWYGKAAEQKDTEAQRKLGAMHAEGLGGKKSPRKALDLWIAAEKAGDPLAPILVADFYFEEITGRKDPAPGQFKFAGGVPVSRIDDAIAWYDAALQRDPRPGVQERAKMALYVLRSLRSSNVQVSSER